MRIWCGIDWSERHHDVALVDDEGALVAKRRIPESAAGFRQLLELSENGATWSPAWAASCTPHS